MVWGSLCCVCGGVLAVLLLAAMLLRLAVFVTNSLLGPGPQRPVRAGGIPEWDWDDWDDEAAPPVRLRSRGPVVPGPGIGTGTLAVFVTALLWGLAFVLAGFGAEELGLRMNHFETRLAAAIVSLPVAALTLTTMLVMTLPTTFWRGAMVSFVFGVIVLAALILVGFPLVLLFR